jgi:hypothetical protein
MWLSDGTMAPSATVPCCEMTYQECGGLLGAGPVAITNIQVRTPGLNTTVAIDFTWGPHLGDRGGYYGR